jgi:hypothetical protein
VVIANANFNFPFWNIEVGLSYWASGGLRAGIMGGQVGGRACPLH